MRAKKQKKEKQPGLTNQGSLVTSKQASVSVATLTNGGAAKEEAMSQRSSTNPPQLKSSTKEG